ncbi:NUDIX domain-containing protein [Candidatus Saccharibacteria bacterium]|nr:MAG: NUDIX domain-containing protein [Candidatus Saccharibacteria bacterium]
MSSDGVVQKAGGIVRHQTTHKIAVVTNELGKCVLPKGSIESGESVEAAARREIYEETGLEDLMLVRELGVLMRPGHESAHSQDVDVVKHIHLYLFSTTSDSLKPVQNDSVSANWIAPDELASTLSWLEEYDFIRGHCP